MTAEQELTLLYGLVQQECDALLGVKSKNDSLRIAARLRGRAQALKSHLGEQIEMLPDQNNEAAA